MDLRQKALDLTTIPEVKDLLLKCPNLLWSNGNKRSNFDYTFDNCCGCCAQEDAYILQQLVKVIKPNNILEIGCYVGWSTLNLAKHCTGKVTAIDTFSEGKNRELIKKEFWSNLENNKITNVTLIDLSEQELKPEKYSLIFVDVYHLEDKPIKDVELAVSCLDEKGYIVIHDSWMPSVKVACDWLDALGFKSYTFKVDSELKIYTKGDLSWITIIVV